jgi:cell division protein FtsW
MSQEPSWDSLLLASLFLLAGTGLAALWSASSGYALSLGKPASWFLVRQFRYFVPALALFALCAALPLERLRAKAGIITLAGLFSLLLPFIPGLGENRNGATRWIDLGITTFQPSEIWKVVLVFYLAHILDRKKTPIEEGSAALIPPFLLVSVGCLIVFLQNDLSTAAIAALAAMVVFWISGAPLTFFAGIVAVAAPLGILSILTSDFRLKRILSFLYPAYEPHGQSYQILGSLRAVGSGGLMGKGLGLGTHKLGSIPEVQSDFIFAAWAEETGFIGIIAFALLWGFMAWRCYRRAIAEEDSFRSWLGFGLMTLLLLEVIVNIAMVSGSIPATGIALPFFSAGGTSLLGTSAIVGLLVNLSRPSQARGPANV